MARRHGIVIVPTSAHVVVEVDGQKVAESNRAVVLEETGLPPRYYLPADDVRADLLRPSSRETRCPFKGSATYWSVELDGKVHEDLVWSYADPIPGAEAISGRLCFYNERVQLWVDGRQEHERKARQ